LTEAPRPSRQEGSSDGWAAGGEAGDIGRDSVRRCWNRTADPGKIGRMNAADPTVARPPPPSPRERLADLWVNGAGVVAAVLGVAALLAIADPYRDGWTLASALVYGMALIGSFAISALYNARRPTPPGHWLRRLDHAAIYALIAGTYTPFALGPLRQGDGIPLIAAVWGTALLGIVLKLAWPRRFVALSIALYLALGWSIMVDIDGVVATVPASAIVLILLGGVVYSAGVPIYLARRMRFHVPLWHGFVLSAAACHYAAIALVIG
jgi:hemolysin III